MAEQQFPYDMMVQEALRGVVRQSLTQVCKDGFRGEHHFYITFKTQAPNVALPDFLHQQYPQEMTIVLQHQFWDLTVEENQFSVGLSFSGVQHKLVIPFSAVTHFTDPSVGFGLQFGDIDEAQKQSDSKNSEKTVILREVSPEDQKKLETTERKQPKQEIKSPLESYSTFDSGEASEEKNTKSKETETAEIVSLERFRKDPAPKS